MNKRGEISFEVLILLIIISAIITLIFLEMFVSSLPTSSEQCNVSCLSLNYTFYKYYEDGYYRTIKHCFCFDENNKPLDIGKP